MSLFRLIIWSSLIGGWCAFFGWLFAELILGRFIDDNDIRLSIRMTLAGLMAILVAVPIGGGISVAGGLTSPHLTDLIKRLVLGFAGGVVGGLITSLVGGCIFGFTEQIPVIGFLSRVLFWTLIGIGIGVGIGASEGIITKSFSKMRNGLLGGVLGGFLGGILFVPIGIIASSISSRALSFVLLGLFIGFFIGLAQVVLKQAWLTVEAGFRPGRQMILGGDLVTMGTSEKASLIFIAIGAKGVEPMHLKISKQQDGRYLLEDNQSRTGTLLNGQPIKEPMALKDGDAIQLGVNVVRFKERAKHADGKLPPPVVVTSPATAPLKPAPAPSAVQAMPPRPAPVPVPSPAARPPSTPVLELPPKPAAPMPAAPAAPAQPQEGRCPICDKKIVGIPGQRRCKQCFTTF